MLLAKKSTGQGNRPSGDIWRQIPIQCKLKTWIPQAKNNWLENQLLLISINFTPKTSHSCLKNWYTRLSRWFLFPKYLCEYGVWTPKHLLRLGLEGFQRPTHKVLGGFWKTRDHSSFYICLFWHIFGLQPQPETDRKNRPIFFGVTNQPILELANSLNLHSQNSQIISG